MKKNSILLIIVGIILLFIVKPDRANAATIPDGYTLYTVSNYSQFKAAMNAGTTTKKYILLNSDIVYGFSSGTATTSTTSTVESLYYTTDTIIDGSGSSGTSKYSLLFGYTGTTNAYSADSPLRILNSNLTVTFKNLSIGSSTYKNFTNGGLVYPYTNQGTSMNLNVVVNNVTFNISGFNGTPFNSYYADNNTITFQGNNTFTSSSTTSGAYFSSGFENLIFDSGSNTTISVAGSGTSEVFSGEQDTGTLNITLNDGANLIVSNGKTTLAKSNAFTLNVNDSASFTYNLVNGSGSTTAGGLNTSSSTTINAGNNSIIDFESTKTSVTSWGLNGTTTLNTTSPKKVVFATNAATPNALFTNASMTINRKDSINTNNYQSSTLSAGATTTSDYVTYDVAGSSIVSSSNTAGKTAWVYEPIIAVTSVDVDSTVAMDQSDLNINGLTTTNSSITTSEVNSKIADHALVSEDLTTNTAQTAITNTTSNDLINESVTNSGTSIYSDLKAQTYYIYTQLRGLLSYSTAAGNFTTSSTSKWVENEYALPVGIFVEFPTEASFSSSMMGDYTSEHYSIINHSNTNVFVSVSAFKTLTTEFGIVPELADNSIHQTTLDLKLSAPLTENILSMDLTTVNTSSAIELSSYIENSTNVGTFYFVGDYSGPLDGIRNSTYTLSFNVSH
ncbi:hypothetical protein ACYSNU_18310 [Enterococcus sp. LJL120]|uniref:hypothetical protein n=1 Tax=Enterococcus sp. HY326 TaxID=2971265 RepID=UPI00223F6A11|nr:hypothetical protein [Enterococcus sp. HY326]